ncbi:lantibiotic dehydratase, partial [Streptomyces lancefieldiae]
MTRQRPCLYEAAGQAMLRAAVHTTEPAMPPWPSSTVPVEEWRAWLSTVWSDTDFRQTVSQASPHLAEQVRAIIDGRTPKARRMRRAALATARYAIRYARRSTPYGLFAGVAPLAFEQAISLRIGDEHQSVARPEPVGLEDMLSTWESDAARMADTEVCVNTLAYQRDQHIHVPSEGHAEFRLALSPALRLVLDLARSPIGYRQLSDKLASEFPAVSRTARDRLLGELLRVRLLRSSLRAPATVADPADVLEAVVFPDVIDAFPLVGDRGGGSVGVVACRVVVPGEVTDA